MHIERLKKAAKQLHKQLSADDKPTLMQVQHLLAQSHGFKNWDAVLEESKSPPVKERSSDELRIVLSKSEKLPQARIYVGNKQLGLLQEFKIKLHMNSEPLVEYDISEIEGHSLSVSETLQETCSLLNSFPFVRRKNHQNTSVTADDVTEDADPLRTEVPPDAFCVVESYGPLEEMFDTIVACARANPGSTITSEDKNRRLGFKVTWEEKPGVRRIHWYSCGLHNVKPDFLTLSGYRASSILKFMCSPKGRKTLATMLQQEVSLHPKDAPQAWAVRHDSFTAAKREGLDTYKIEPPETLEALIEDIILCVQQHPTVSYVSTFNSRDGNDFGWEVAWVGDHRTEARIWTVKPKGPSDLKEILDTLPKARKNTLRPLLGHKEGREKLCYTFQQEGEARRTSAPKLRAYIHTGALPR